MRKDYTTADYQTCRTILENRSAGMRTDWSAQAITVAALDRCQRLRLADGPEGQNTEAAGELVRLSGLGVKTAEEAIRLGIS